MDTGFLRGRVSPVSSLVYHPAVIPKLQSSSTTFINSESGLSVTAWYGYLVS